MAVLTDEQRREAWREWMETTSRLGIECAITKAELREAFDAIDTFFEANKATINNALPEPAKSSLSPQAKALLLAILLRVRYDVGA